MTDSRAALGSDRLPWLNDEPTPAKPTPRKQPTLPNLWVPAAAMLLVIAGGSYWLGTRSANEEEAAASHSNRTIVAPLPEARTPEPQQVAITPVPQVNPAPAPEVQSTPQREVRIERPKPVKRIIIIPNPEAPPEASDEVATTTESKAAATLAKPAAERPPKAWPASKSDGAKGRIVRVGAFGTRQNAKLGWRYMVKAYPAVAHLKATVVGDRNSRGRHFYRFQIGTTSQAHSEVLCQRMEKIHLSCAVVGLSWKPTGVER